MDNKPTPIDDIEILKKVMDNEINIKDLDEETKIRIIYLCQQQIFKIKETIENKESYLDVLNNVIDILENSKKE